MNPRVNGHGPPPPIDIAIIGGGIGGLALLIGIFQHTSPMLVRPHLYESAPAFSEIGAGIGFGPNARKAMALVSPAFHDAYCRIAADAEIVTVDGRTKAVWNEFRMGMDGRGVSSDASNNKLKAGELICTVHNDNPKKNVHRARFLDEMISLLPESSSVGSGKDNYVSFKKRCTGITFPEADSDLDQRITIHFADNTTASAHAAIGSDGVKSRIRQILLEQPSIAAPLTSIAPRFTGKYAYRGLIPMSEAVEALGPVAKRSHMIWGYDGHLVCFPVEQGKTLNIVAFRTQMKNRGEWQNGEQWVLPANIDQVLEDYQNWSEPVKSLLRNLRKPDVWAIFEHPPAPTYYLNGQLCLLGDCAHSSSPHQGSGAGMAIEDAAVLSRLLSHVKSPMDLKEAFKGYDAVRRPRTQRLVTTSRDAGMLYDFQKEGVSDDPESLRADIETRMRWIWDVDLEAQIRGGESLMQVHA